MGSKLLLLCTSAVLLGAAASGDAQTLAIRAGTLIPVAGPPIRNAVVLIANGKIASVRVGARIPSGVPTLSAAVVMPGLVDAHCFLGIENETDEPVDALTPDLRAMDTMDVRSPALRRASAAGVTTAGVSLGDGNIAGGQMAAIRLAPAPLVLKPYAAQKMSAAPNLAIASRAPTSKGGAQALAQAALRGEALSGTAQIGLLQGETNTRLSERGAAIRSVTREEVPVFIHAPETRDALRALDMTAGLRRPPVLVHSVDAWRIAEALKRRGASVVLGPARLADLDRVLANPGRLAKAGVRVAFCTDGPAEDPASLRMTAHLSVRNGMPPDAAIRALTLSGAEALGVAHRTGSIVPGKDADLLLLTGDPLDLTSRVTAVVAGGRVVRKERTR